MMGPFALIKKCIRYSAVAVGLIAGGCYPMLQTVRGQPDGDV